MSITDRARVGNEMPVNSETILEMTGYPEETPAEAAERDILDILASFKGELSAVVSTLVCGASASR